MPWIPWRGVAPIQLVIMLVGTVMVSTALGIVVIATIATVRDVQLKIPQELATVCISSLTALGGLLTPNTGMMSPRADRAAVAAGAAAATAVVEHEDAHRAERRSEGGGHRGH